MAYLPKKPCDMQEPMAGRCPSDDMFAQCQAVNLQRDLPVTTPWGIQLPSNRSQRK